MKDNLEAFLEENSICYDRFTFDKIFKFLFNEGFSNEEAKNIILTNCSISALVYQERIENNMYKKISPFKESNDLIELRNEIYNSKLLNKN